MSSKITKLWTNWRFLLLVTLLVLSLVAIWPQVLGVKGVEIHSISSDSAVIEAGLINPSTKITPTNRERILAVNNAEIKTVEDYYSAVSELHPNRTVRIETNKQIYTFITPEAVDGKVDLGVKVKEASSSNLRMGLDLEGGTRLLLQPAGEISEDDLEITVDSLKERLNVYGLRDIVVRSASDLEGNVFILIEIAGVT